MHAHHRSTRRLRRPALATLAILVAACAGPPSGMGRVAVSPVPVAIRPSMTPAASPARPPATPEPVACPALSAPGEPGAADGVGSPAAPALLDLFERHPIVAIGERHGWQAEHDVLAALVCDPAFLSSVDAIVVEFGNRQLQPILDGYLSGEDVTSDDSPRSGASRPSGPGSGSTPPTAGSSGSFRSVNAGVAQADRIRVLAGDPPVPAGTVLPDQGIATSRTRPARTTGGGTALVDGTGRGPRRWTAASGSCSSPAPGTWRGGSSRTSRRRCPSGWRPRILDPCSSSCPGSGFGEAAGDADERLRGWPLPGFGEVRGTWLARLDACSSRGSPGRAQDACPSEDERRGSARSPTATCCSSVPDRCRHGNVTDAAGVDHSTGDRGPHRPARTPRARSRLRPRRGPGAGRHRPARRRYSRPCPAPTASRGRRPRRTPRRPRAASKGTARPR